MVAIGKMIAVSLGVRCALILVIHDVAAPMMAGVAVRTMLRSVSFMSTSITHAIRTHLPTIP